MIFMKHRNLEKAVVLSLILSTGVYGSAWAEEITTDEFTKGQHTDGNAIEGITIDGNTIKVTESTIVNSVSGNVVHWQPNKNIDIEKNVDIIFNKVWLQDANITG